ncbi:AraC family transcriptional regulator [Cohnella hongkongensis]|uniref:Helix-turn-helix domain-containing protein n=1 Tax=Cohnella hongkongensis TaxID=178337 RepID=A0ABV9F739_9BACL
MSPTYTLKGQSLFRHDRLVFVNRASEDFEAPMHDHDFIEFAYVAEGTGFHHIGGQVHPIHKGQLFYIPIGQPHVFRPASADVARHPLSVYNCVFSPELLERIAFFVTSPELKAFIAELQGGSASYFYLSDADDSIERLMQAMHREFSMPREASADYLDTLLVQLLIVVLRLRRRPPAASSRKFAQFDHLLAYMEQHLADELTLAHLAQKSRWSERHLQRLFLRHTEQSFKECLQTLRIQKSCLLLRTTGWKIGEIAEKVGYRDPASFLAVFKRIAGMTPSQYRKAASVPP